TQDSQSAVPHGEQSENIDDFSTAGITAPCNIPATTGAGNATETTVISRQGPFGDIGLALDRDPSGRFVVGNRAALVVGQHWNQFWQAQDGARREIVAAIIADAGHTTEDAPRALTLTAEGIAQASLLRDAAFLRVVESAGPLTSSGRTRRA